MTDTIEVPLLLIVNGVFVTNHVVCEYPLLDFIALVYFG